jgi:predicted lipoprotein with Yx(FWY)xxD motif
MRTVSGGPYLSRLAGLSVVLVLGITVVACSGSGAVPSIAPQSGSPDPQSASPTSSPAAPSESSGGGRGDYNYETEYGTGTPAGSDAPAASEVSGESVEITTATGPIGTWLTGPEGLTLYTFAPDSANTSTCIDDCAEAWPPFTIGAEATLQAGDGVGGELTTFERLDGTLQVAYDGAPLYYFVNDTAPGDTNGQGLGDNWFAAEP